MNDADLCWVVDVENCCEDAVIGVWPDDGVRFTLQHMPTNYRRGPWFLLIDVCGGSSHQKWGCFDSADMPARYFHSQDVAKEEAGAIAAVLLRDRRQYQPPLCELQEGKKNETE